ncbi:inactive hydroxysteroid dehydrogenase-like protein 1 isoform X1 [Exaiptasia diaphana]|uniref:Uncharacterized protein n=1 Tax=Exaiptasia diaphana TaxID=2652724 RepID=A0A913XGZ0_EXADI|nr:inactive hydroxysteroid dehydrogenase-like protein 1 isoform X1 [Exaiptasia diaphana]
MAANILSVVGGVFLAYHGINFILQVIQGVKAFVLPSLGFRKDLKAFGSWAVVTGCTDGIGKSYAKQLAKQGLNIVLMSRNLEKLKKVEEEIRSEYNVETRIIVIDFSGGQEIYQDIGDKLKDLEIGILVNNVGIGIGKNDFFLTYPMKAFNEQINANDLSTVMITYIVLPIMVARKRGLIINISSILALAPSPFNATYPATKAFMDVFGQCISAEYSDKGIQVQNVTPGYVSTKLTNYMEKNWLVPSPDRFVHQALGTVGKEKKTMGYWSHSLSIWFGLNIMPVSMRDSIIWNIMSSFKENASKEKTQ